MSFELLVAGAIALATLRRYSVVQTAALTSIALFLSSGFTAVSGAPITGLQSTVEQVRRMDPWEQPCGVPAVAALKQQSHRHNVNRTLKRVRTQLRIAKNHYKKETEGVNEIYSKVSDVMKEQYTMNWFPQKHIDWYEKEARCLEKPKMAEKVLPRLHDDLQRIAIAFHHLEKFQLKTDVNTEPTRDKRNAIIAGMKMEIIKMLCEVESALQTLDLQLPRKHKETIVTESKSWSIGGDSTIMAIQDWGVLRLYRKILNVWTRVFQKRTAKFKASCDRTKVDPVDQKPESSDNPGPNKIPTGRKKLHGRGKKRTGQRNKGAAGGRRRMNRNKRKKVVQS